MKFPSFSLALQCRGSDVEWLSAAVLPAIQEEPHAAALSQRDPHPGPGAQPDGGRGGYRALWGSLRPGRQSTHAQPSLRKKDISKTWWYLKDGIWCVNWILFGIIQYLPPAWTFQYQNPLSPLSLHWNMIWSHFWSAFESYRQGLLAKCLHWWLSWSRWDKWEDSSAV